MITVVKAPPFATVQDLGREGHRAIGVPVAGAMDRDTLIACNRIVGNADDAAVIEWAVAGGTLRFDAPSIIAMGGAEASATLRDAPMLPWHAYDVRVGDELRVERIVNGRFLYVAVRGGIDVPIVLGSRSTLLSATLGGFDGRRLRTGDVVRVHDAPAMRASRDHVASSRDPSARIEIVRGPQASLFDADSWHTFLTIEWRVSSASDRSGYRLDGPTLQHAASADFPSEPTCVGAIQVPSGGSPIVVMHDGPTVGGYPKIAVIRAHDISGFAQRATGDPVRFVLVE